MKKPLLIAALFVPAALAQVDPTALVKQSVENYERNWRESRNWKYQQTDITWSDGSEETEVSEITPLEGTPFERVISKNGEKLSPEEERKQEHKYEKALARRRGETPEQRDARIRKFETERSFVTDIPDAYNFELIGEEAVRGRPAWVIKMTPREGFVPTKPHASMLEHIEGKLWLDKEDLQWARADAHVRDTIGIGWVLARIGPGAHIHIEQIRVAPGFWMPSEIKIKGAARVLLVHNKVLNEELTYSGFQRAAGDSANISRRSTHPKSGKTKSFR